MNCIEQHCQGESHKSNNKPCQDCAFAESNDLLSMAIVCDGHEVNDTSEVIMEQNLPLRSHKRQ